MTDLLFQDEVRSVVREAYGAIDRGGGDQVAQRLYRPADIDRVGEETAGWALGVGDPVRHAGIRAGDVVLDVGCGGGIDTVLAADRVGPEGQVVALDMLPGMAARTQAATVRAGVADRCVVRVAEMEALPLPGRSVDVVISNGVLNLSPRKRRALLEAHRVLRPGGTLCVVDLVVDDDLPPEVLSSGAAWAGCIAGAVSERALRRVVERAGFEAVGFGARRAFSLDDVLRYPLFTDELVQLMRRALPPAAQRRVATSIAVRATRSGGARRLRHAVGPSGVTTVDAIDAAAVEAPGVAVRPLKQVEDVHLKVLDVAPGASTPWHQHSHAHEGVVIAGHGALRLASGRRPLGPGSVFTVHPNDWHAIECDPGEAPLRFACMDCFVD